MEKNCDCDKRVGKIVFKTKKPALKKLASLMTVLGD